MIFECNIIVFSWFKKAFLESNHIPKDIISVVIEHTIPKIQNYKELHIAVEEAYATYLTYGT